MSEPLPRGVRVVREPPSTRAAGYRTEVTPAAVIVDRSWRSIWGVFRGGFLALWGMGFGSGGLLTLFHRHGWHPSPPPIPIGLLFLGLGLGGLYVGLAILANRTRARVRPGTIEVTHGPLPWPGAFTVREPSLEVHVFTVHRNDVRNGSATWPVRMPTYEVCVDDGPATRAVFVQIRNYDDAVSTAHALREAIRSAS